MSSSSTSAAKNNQPRPCKYKDSCDACARSKVKCNRVRPSCQRCVRNGIVCRYSPARRGKATTLSDPSNTSESPPQNAVGVHDGFFADASLDFVDHDFSAQPDLATSHYPNFNIDMAGVHMSSRSTGAGSSDTREQSGPCDQLMISGPGSSPDFGDALGAGTTQSGQPDWGDFHADRWANSNPLLLDPLLSPASSITTTHLHDSLIKQTHGLGDGTAPSSAEGMCSNSHDCIRLALTTLQRLHVPSSTCVLQATPATNKTSGMDVILETNRLAIENVLTILQCPCAADEPNAILLALICSQIIDGYQRISLIRQNLADNLAADQPGGDSNGSEPHSRVSSPDTAMDTDLDVPVAIGGYRLDSRAKRRMISSVLLSDLAKVGEAVDKFDSPAGRGSRSTSGNGGGGSEVVSSFKLLLMAKLRATVRAVRCELVRF